MEHPWLQIARFPNISEGSPASEAAESAELRREDVMEVHARMAAKLRDQIDGRETTNQIGKTKNDWPRKSSEANKN